MGSEEIRRRAALFGRKINRAEHQLSFVEHLAPVADDQLLPDEAVRAYHGALERLGVRPHRSLADDLVLTETAGSYSGKAVGLKKSSPPRHLGKTAAPATGRQSGPRQDVSRPANSPPRPTSAR